MKTKRGVFSQQKWLSIDRIYGRVGRVLCYCVCLMMPAVMVAMVFVYPVRADLKCAIDAQRGTCSPLPVIVEGRIDLTAGLSYFEFVAHYQSCFSERSVKIQGRVLQPVTREQAWEFELLGERFDPVTDFIAFPRTVAYLIVDKSTLQGRMTDVWSAQQLLRYPEPAQLTIPVKCGEKP